MVVCCWMVFCLVVIVRGFVFVIVMWALRVGLVLGELLCSYTCGEYLFCYC